MKQINPKGKLVAIQGLRAYAAILVVIAHAMLTYNEKILSNDEFSMPAGTLGVKMFFLISGFIIYTTSSGMERGFESFRYFMKKRLIRILPLYYVATVIYYIKLSYQGMNVSLDQLVLSFLFVPFVNHNGLLHPVLGQGWTLNFEMFFYAIFAFAILTLSRGRFLFVSGILLLLCAIKLFFPLDDYPGDVLKRLYFFAEPDSLGYFIVGMSIAGIRARFPSHNFVNEIWAMSIVFVFLVAFLGFRNELVVIGFPIKIQIAIISFSCFLLCVFVVEKSQKESLFTNFLHACGDASYSVYLFHGFILGFAARFLSKYNVEFSMIEYTILMTFICIPFGVVTYKYAEKPLIDKLNHLFLGRKLFNNKQYS